MSNVHGRYRLISGVKDYEAMKATVHPFLFFRLESGKPEPCLNLFVFIWDFYLWMVFPVCCVDAALKQRGDPPRKVV